jgi:hypothetical protein
MGLFDTLLTDPMQQGGGYLDQMLGIQPQSNPMALPSSLYTGSQGLLGSSPLGNAIRGALAGSASSVGYKGLSALGAGFLGGQQAASQRRQQMTETASNNFNLARTLALMGMGPFGGDAGASNYAGASANQDVDAQPAASATASGAPAAPAARAASAAGANASSPGYLDDYRYWMDIAQRMAMFGGSDAMINLYKARAEDSPGFMVYKQQTQNGLQLAPDGRTWMNPDGSLNAAATKAGAVTLAQALNARSDLRPGSTATIDGQTVAEAPTLQSMTDPKSGRKTWVNIYPDGRIVPLGTGSGAAINQP